MDRPRAIVVFGCADTKSLEHEALERDLSGMVDVYAVAEHAGEQLGQEPFARFDAVSRALDMLAIEHGFQAAAFGLPLHPVIASVIGDFQDFVSHSKALDLPCAHISVGKPIDIIEYPTVNGWMFWHALIEADFAESFAVGEASTDEVGEFA
jgi:hypothetical protein